jgi:hypothetical protein
MYPLTLALGRFVDFEVRVLDRLSNFVVDDFVGESTQSCGGLFEDADRDFGREGRHIRSGSSVQDRACEAHDKAIHDSGHKLWEIWVPEVAKAHADLGRSSTHLKMKLLFGALGSLAGRK